MPRMIVDFYRIEMPEDAGMTFDQTISTIGAIVDLADRNATINFSPVRLQRSHRWGESIEGDIEKIRMNNLPTRASLEGPVSALDLEDNEGLGEECAFVYFVPLRVLLFQRNRFSISIRNFLAYFSEKSGLNKPIHYEPVISPDTVQKLQRMQVIKRFEVSVAGLDKAELFRNQGHTLEEFLDIQQKFRAPRLKLQLSVGHMRGALRGEAIKEAARKLLRMNSQAPDADNPLLHTMEVEGEYSDRTRDILDLLEAGYSLARQVEPGDDRVIGYETRRQALRSVFQEALPALRSMFND